MSNRTMPLAIGIIIAGVIILLGKLGFFQTVGALFWPLIPLAAGAAFHLLHWNRVLPSGVLIPGGILVVLSLLFLFCSWFGWGWMKVLWPVIPFGVAVGLYEFSSAERIPALRAVSFGIGGGALLLLVIMLVAQVNVYVLALLLIVGGVVLAARRPRIR
ncbi:hypothetical protein [Paenibacillus alkalitolerans]|uniref:hypothetical protein n=1 Tax=Paenibacillus alkalitolerans TaxID=2799335 RepID=UPI0018F31A9E|nr:hypothetical protein [Paenibacillus alkalitolerans]